MDEKKIDQHLKNVPIQMIELVENLNTKAKWAVYVALLENKQMYFNQIKDEFGANATEIDRILKSLNAGGLIFKHAKKFADIKNDNRTYYKPSLLGEMFYDSTFNLVIPKKVTTPCVPISERTNQMSSMVELEPTLGYLGGYLSPNYLGDPGMINENRMESIGET